MRSFSRLGHASVPLPLLAWAHLVLAALSFVAVPVCPARAQIVVTPVAVTASSENGGRQAIDTINGAGLDALGQHGVNADHMWQSAAQAMPTITWDMGQVHALTGFHLWNYNENFSMATLDAGVRFTTIATSLDNVVFTPLPDTYEFARAPGTTTYTGEDYSFVTPGNLPVTARYVRFNVQDNFTTAHNFTGLSEIRFAAVVPEPGTFALLSSGLVCAGAYALPLGTLLLRKRRRKV